MREGGRGVYKAASHRKSTSGRTDIYRHYHHTNVTSVRCGAGRVSEVIFNSRELIKFNILLIIYVIF